MLDVLVLGATGNQGGAVARHLLATGFGVRAIARRPDEASVNSLREHGAEIVAADLGDVDALATAMDGVHGVYCALPFFQENFEREVPYGANVIAAAERTGVRHLVYSAGARSNERTGVPHLDTKGEVERLLRASSVPYTVLRPVAFNYSLAGYRDGALKGELPDPRPGDSMVYQVDEDDHARFAALALLDPQNWIGRGFETASDAVTVDELAAIFSRVLGREVRHVPITWEQEAEIVGDEVVRLARWVEADGPRLDMASYHARFPWLSSIEDYLRRHGWADAA